MAEEQEREVELEEEERNTSRITCEFYTIHPGDFVGLQIYCYTNFMQNCVRGLLSDKCCTCLFISVAVTLPIVSLVVVAFFIFMSYIAHRRYPHIGETGKSRHRNKPLYVYITHLGTSFYGK